MKDMKDKIILFIGISSIMILSSCASDFKFNTDELKNNPDLQSRLYDLIISDQELRSDFMQRLSERPEAMQQMMMNQNLMQEMFSQENMNMLHESEPITLRMMMEHMQQARGTEDMMHDEMMEN